MIVNCNLYTALLASRGYENKDIFQKRGFFPRFFGRMMRLFHLPILNNLSDLDTNDDYLLFFDDCIKDKRVYEIIASKHSDKRLIFYYWNPVSTSISPDSLPSSFEKWSYSISDCNKYHLKHNPTFSFYELFKKSDTSPANIKYDVLFVGKNKGRKRNLAHLFDSLGKMGLRCHAHLTPSHPKLSLSRFKNIPYSEVIELDKSSKAILDYCISEDAGLSLRVMESVFLDKVLLTNCREALSLLFNEGGAYSTTELQRFALEVGRTSKRSREMKEFFDFENWIKRFGL